MRREKRFYGKRVLTVFLAAVIVLAAFFATGYVPVKAAAALPAGSVCEGGSAADEFAANGGEYSSWTSLLSSYKVAPEYGFYPEPTDKTVIRPFGTQSEAAFTYLKAIYGNEKEYELNKDNMLGFDAHEAKKGGIGWTGNDFRVYNTETGRYDLLDVRVSVVDWTAPDTPAYMLLGYGRDSGVHPAFNMWGVLEAKVKIDYFRAGTSEPYILNSHFTFNDIDGKQYMGFSSEGIVNQYASPGSRLLYSRSEGMDIYHYPDMTHSEGTDPNYAMGATFSADSITFLFGNAHLYDGDRKDTWAHFGFYSSTMAPVEPPAPVKEVYDSDESAVTENTLDSADEEYAYSVKQTVPGGYTDASYYKSFVMEDELEPCLEIRETAVYDSKGSDLSSKFNIIIEDNKVKAEAEALDQADFYNNTYELRITAAVKKDADLSSYTDKGTVSIPNRATVTINDNPLATNETLTKYRVPKLSIVKDVDHYKWQVGENIAYSVKVSQIEKDAAATDVVISDVSLPDCLTYDEDSIQVSGVKDAEVVKEGNGWIVKVPRMEYGDEAQILFSAAAGEGAVGLDTVNTASAKSSETAEITDDAVVTVLKNSPQTTDKNDSADKARQQGKSGGGSAAKTGDMTDLALWLAIAAAAGLAAVMTVIKARR